jgi:hypothetical protein
LSASEFAEWLAYNAIDPIGPERADLNAGIIASVIANVNRDPRKQMTAYTAADFMPNYDRVEPKQAEPWRAQKSAMMALMAQQKRNSRKDAKRQRKKE